MTIYLHCTKPHCEFRLSHRDEDLLVIFNRPELHSLLWTNSVRSEGKYGYDDFAPNWFGYGLCADWLEDNRELSLENCLVFYTKATPAELLNRVIAECRRLFSGAEGH